MKIAMIFYLALFHLFTMATSSLSADLENTGAQATVEKNRVYVVNSYRYVPTSSKANIDTGQALCGTRCNGFSVDYQNIVKPPGWRLILLAQDKDITLDMGNPFIDGKCICVADEYIVKVNDLYMSK